MLAGIVWYAVGRKGAGPSPSPAATTPSTVGVPAFAPQGELTPGFPQALILDPAAAMSNSYSINYSSTTNQYTAQWNSSSSMVALYDAYKAYLPAHGWTIVNDQSKGSIGRGLYAQNATSDVSVAIVKVAAGAQALVTYLMK